ncbi:MAG TPA: glycosyltransferase family 39 protein [Deltaproteobacteria bacterium]|nr:glycosyltransferase family 39 protein [Deltaproteobacteria bacterium]
MDGTSALGRPLVRLLIVAGMAGVLLYGLGNLPYLETSEARYAEIAREMAVSGDWVTPRLTFIKHFDKPPLTYWVTAAAFKLLGLNDFSGRLPLVIAALGILWFTWRLARLLFPEERPTAALSVTVLFSSLLFLALSRSLTTDLYLALSTAGAVSYLFRWFYHDRQTRDALLSALFLGLGLLTKGHVILVFFLLPWLPAAFSHRQARPIKVLDICVFMLVPLLLFLPWFLAVLRENPQLLRFFVHDQTYGRIATNMHHRSEPVYFHLLVLCGGMLFWFTYFLARLPRTLARRENRTENLLLLFTLIPLIFFSLNRSKLAPYLLPALPFYAVLIAHWLHVYASQPAMRWADRINLVLAGVLVGGEIALPWLPLHAIQIPMWRWEAFAVLSLILWLGMLAGWRKWPAVKRLGFAGLNILLFLAAVSVAPALQEHINGFEAMAAAIARDRGAAPCRIIAYEERLPSITFYTGIRVIQIPHDRNLRFEDTAARQVLDEYVSNDISRIPRLLAQPTLTYLIIKQRDWRDLQNQLPGIERLARDFYAGPKYMALVNRRQGN